MTRIESHSERYAGERCTLNGQDAIIGGRLCDFARVSTLPPKNRKGYTPMQGEWAWDTVHRIMENGGAFKL